MRNTRRYVIVGSRAWLASFAVLACTRANPSFDGDSGKDPMETGTTTGPVSTTSDGGPPLTTTGVEPDGGGTTMDPPIDESTTGSEPGGSSSESSSESTGLGEPSEYVFFPFLAECLHPPAPNPEECAAVTDPGYIQIDADEPALGGEAAGYLAFEITNEFELVDSVVLRMEAHPFDPGSPSGAIWEVAPFTYESLFMTAPAPAGLMPVGPPVAPVDATLLVEFTLAPEVVVPGQPLFLGIFTESGNGVDYADLDSKSPPELIVTAW